jgi:pSer/pThr/pTyr-binding forkhead associated (FHA) protein
MSVLRGIENRIESLFEGVFGRAFRTHVQPVELARKLAKEMDEHRSVSVSRVYVPNEYTLYLSPPDRSQFSAYEGSLVGELQEYLGEHARREGYALLGPPRVLLETDADLAVGEFGISTRLTQPEAQPDDPARLPEPVAVPVPAAPLPTPSADVPEATVIYSAPDAPAPPSPPQPDVTLTVDGRVVPLSSDRVVVGRSRECDVRIDDGNVSRRHAELSRDHDERWTVVDLGSTNGTEVNGRRISRRTPLADGDRIAIGGTELVFGRSLP